MLLKLSSPGVKRGVLYEEYKKAQDGLLAKTYAIFRAPTWMMNDLIKEQDFAEEFKMKPDDFDVEYRSNFKDALSNFILPERIDAAVLSNVKFLLPEDTMGVKYIAAIDAAFKGDAFTFSVVGFVKGRLKLFVSKGWKGSRTKPVDPNEVAEYIRSTCKRYNVDWVSADQFAFQPLREIFNRYGVTLKENVFSLMFKQKIYYNLKKLFHAQQIDIVHNDILIRELKELVVEQSNNGNVKIHHPAGGSDDYSDSLAVAAFLATETLAEVEFEFASTGRSEMYGIATDAAGVAFQAPSVDMLTESGHYGEGIEDNSGDYARDPLTGQLKRKSDLEEPDEADTDSGFLF